MKTDPLTNPLESELLPNGGHATIAPLRVVVASSSLYRCWWYVEQLRRYEMDVTTAINGIDCVEKLRSLRPDVLLLEPSLLWGGSHGVLAVRSEEPELQQIPVVLIAVDGVPVEWFQLAHYPVQDLLVRKPTGQQLATCLIAAARHAT